MAGYHTCANCKYMLALYGKCLVGVSVSLAYSSGHCGSKELYRLWEARNHNMLVCPPTVRMDNHSL